LTPNKEPAVPAEFTATTSPNPLSDRTSNQFTYTGTWPELFGVLFVQGLLTVITLGIYYPWGFCQIRKWVLEHTYAEGRQLTFVGSGSELFGILFVQVLLTIITLGIWYLLQLPTHKLLVFDVKHTKFHG
jgi:uncharacterized membrane protein YjgN (DUF898 family)